MNQIGWTGHVCMKKAEQLMQIMKKIDAHQLITE